MKIKTILKEAKRQIDNGFGVNSIIIPKYYYDKYDMLFVNIEINDEMSMNVRIRKGWNGSGDCICVLSKYTNSDGYEQEGYANNIQAERESVDYVIKEVIKTIKSNLSVKERVNSWNIYYDYDAKYNSRRVDNWIGDKYLVINNNLIITNRDREKHRDYTGKEMSEYLNGLIKK